MSRIYFGEYHSTVTDDHYIFLPEQWNLPESVYYAFVEDESKIRYLCCSDNKDTLLNVNNNGNILTRGKLAIAKENKLLLSDEFLEYMRKRKREGDIVCYGNIDRFEIWLSEELKLIENSIDTQGIEKELQELGVF
ncbi:MAG: hypothetical protein LUI87_04280 [Lachnospiraceae bacterium]|nr:hypothetical protein [Lachnospiraceae bacterium]